MKKTLLSRLMFIMFVFSCAAVLGVSLYSRSVVAFLTLEMEKNIQSWLKEAARRGAALVTVEELQTYQKPQDMDLPSYKALRHKLINHAAESGILYIYYLRPLGGGKFQYIIDNDLDEKTVVNLNTPPTDVSDTPGLPGALEGRVSSAGLGSYMSEWGGLLSAYAPIFDSDGAVVAVCGVDINDELIVSAERRDKLLGILLIVTAVIVLASGMLCLAAYSREARFARESNIFKSKFLSSLGHEMRSPLSAMSANAQLASELLAAELLNIAADCGPQVSRRDDEIVKEIQGALFAVSSEAERLARMSGAAVTLGAEQSGHRQSGEKSALDIAGLLRTVCEIYRPMTERRGNRLVFSEFVEPDDPVSVYGNADELSEVLINFIANANEHTRDGNIHVTATHENGFVTVAVSDNGKGIDADILPRIFERRPRRGVSGKTGGIGLSICRDIVEDHKGQIGIESTPGKGTKVYFRLPVEDNA